jgi:hypothetical protein
MTDPTAPVTPRTAAGRQMREFIAALLMRPVEKVDPRHILAIEREAGSTDALRAAILRFCDLPATLTVENLPTFVGQISAALAASDAGEAWVESVVGEPGMYASDARPAGIDVPRLEQTLNDMTEGDSPDLWWDVDMGVWYATPRIHDLAEKIAAEYTRLSRESDR